MLISMKLREPRTSTIRINLLIITSRCARIILLSHISKILTRLVTSRVTKNCQLNSRLIPIPLRFKLDWCLYSRMAGWQRSFLWLNSNQIQSLKEKITKSLWLTLYLKLTRTKSRPAVSTSAGRNLRLSQRCLSFRRLSKITPRIEPSLSLSTTTNLILQVLQCLKSLWAQAVNIWTWKVSTRLKRSLRFRPTLKYLSEMFVFWSNKLYKTISIITNY